MKNLTTKLTIGVLTIGFGLSSVAQADKSANTVTFWKAQQTQEPKGAPAKIPSSGKILSIEKAILAPDFREKPEIKTLRIDVQRSVDGGVHGGGGVSASDAKGQRRLLDLIEEDDVEHFLPETVLRKIPGSEDISYVYELLSRMSRVYFTYGKTCSDPVSLRSQESGYGTPRFVVAVGLSYLPFILNKQDRLSGAGWCLKDDYEKLLSGILSSIHLNPVKPLRWAFTDSNLEEINDEGLIRIQNPESKKQLAIQKDELVLINRKEFMQLDEESKEALFIHESVLHAVLILNPQHIEKNGTQYIRAYVRSLLKFYKNFPDIPFYIVSDSYKDLGIK